MAMRVATREVLTGSQRQKMDPSDDTMFYDSPKIVQHVDDGFRAQLTQLYRERLPPGGTMLDLMSSWVSHLPPEVTYAKVVGHGMNAEELSRNPRLDSFFLRNLNVDPTGWALADNSLDAVLCTVSVQYLQQPERVFGEVLRVLKPGGVFIVSFSNRMFFTKAIAAWRDGTDYSRIQLVKQYFGACPGYEQPEVINRVSVPEDPSLLGKFWTAAGALGGGMHDPFHAVLARKKMEA
ncbi:CGL2 [Auxenochlorella protothecoides x Auxenochlorella symbiontica]